MDEYPNSDEEFELMYGEELDLLRDLERDAPTAVNPIIPNKKARKSSDITNVGLSQSNQSDNITAGSSEISYTTKENAHIENNICSSLNSAVHDELEVTTTAVVNAPLRMNNNLKEKGVSKKRTSQELFGEVLDIPNEEIIEGRTKKPKSDSQRDGQLALIEHILRLRILNKVHQSPFVTSSKAGAINNVSKYNISYQIPKYSFVGITIHNGEVVYLRCHSERYEKEEMQRTIQKSTFAGIMGEQFKEVWKKAEEYINLSLNKENPQNEDALKNSSNVQIVAEETETTTQLWVDLYKPKRYMELLSDESTNRTLLKWVKLWDKIVFNRKPKQKMIHDAKAAQTNKFRKQELTMNLDEHGRPEYKVVLLCGPPGLGKTTLAHMVARHAGYNVVEINASDDRSVEEFKKILENATQMRSVIDRERRPNCIVFDEIDGAPSASIDYLVKFINGTNTTTKKKKGAAQTPNLLKRPVICICNDVYVPALRPLRQIAFVLNFPPTASARLAERLNEIARCQKIKADFGALNAFCEKSGNDIRSCLSVLHFFKSLGKPITLSEVYKTSVGQKDMQKGLFAVWNDIFHVQQLKHKTFLNLNNVKDASLENHASLKNRMAKILQVVNAFGDYERLAQGVFENYTNMTIRDVSLMSTCESLEWFCSTDVLNKQIYSTHDYSLLSYLPYAFVVWHFAFAGTSWQKLTYPSAGQEAKNRLSKNAAVVSEIMKGMRPSVRAFVHSSSLKQDVLPLLSQIIIPSFRPVNLHLFTDKEKECLQNVVFAMIDYNLNYVQERMPEGNYVYNIDPNIDDVILFPGSKLKRVLSYFNKQLIAREIEVTKMRGAEMCKLSKSLDTSAHKELTSTNKENGVSNVPNHLQKLKAKVVKPSKGNAVAKDFFGRVITKPTTNVKAGPELNNGIWYQYKEGYNNAVRKNIKISSLK